MATLRSVRVYSALAAMLAIVACLPVVTAEFTNWDDPEYVTANRAVRDFDLRGLLGGLHVGTYAPLTMLTYAVDHAVFGPSPRAMHAMNLLFHAAAAAACCWVTTLWLGDARAGFLVAALFAVHPLHVEPVAWISGRKEVLAGLFALLTLGAYERHRAGAGRRWFGLALASQLLALASKGTAAMVPVLLLALVWRRDRRVDKRTLRELAPFALLAAVFAGIAWLGQTHARAAWKIEGLTALDSVLVASRGLIFYLVKLVAPVGLSAYYPYPPGALGWTYVWAPAAVLALAVIVVVCARRASLYALAASLYVVPLLPVLQLVPLGSAVAADRYAYLPALGPLLVVGAAFARWGCRGTVRIAAGLVVIVLAALSFSRSGVWRDSESLWSDVLAKQPIAEVAWLNRAEARTARGDIAGAQADLRALTALTPRSADGWNNRGSAWFRLGDDARARVDFERAVQIDPDHGTARLNLGLARARAGDFEGAAADLARAAELDPRDATPLVKRGVTMMRLDQPQDAITDFTAALARDASSVEALANRAIALALVGEGRGALADLDRAVALAPDDVQVLYTRAQLRARAGDAAGARADLQRVLSLDPGHAGARAALSGGD